MENKQIENIRVDALDIQSYISILLKRKWIFLACFIMSLILGLTYLQAKPSIYRTIAVLDVGSGYNMPVDSYQETRYHHLFMATQTELMEGHTLAKMVSQNLGDWENKVPEKYLEPEIIVSVVRGTSMIDIWVESPYREFTKAYSEILLREFVKMKRERREQSSVTAVVSLTKEIDRLSNKISGAQATLQKYREENEDLIVEEYGQYSPRQLVSLSAELSELESDKMLIGEQIKALKESDDPSFWISVIDEIQKSAVTPALQKDGQTAGGDQALTSDNPGEAQQSGNVGQLPFVFVLEKGQGKRWEELKDQYKKLASKFARISQVYRPTHPDRIKMEDDIETVRREMKAELASLLEIFNAQYKTIQLEEGSLENSIKKRKEATLKFSSKIAKLESLKEEVERSQLLYGVLIKRIDEIEISADVGLETVFVIEKPRTLVDPVAPKKMKIILLAIVFGAGLGCSVVFFLDYLDDSISSVDDLKEYVGINALGVVHSVDWNQQDLTSHNVTVHVDGESVEAYRSIRTNIILSSPEQDLRSILVTSALPSEGKTTVSVNTAIVLAQSGLRVLIIDGDLRRPTIHKMFGRTNTKGVTSILIGEENFENCVQPTTVEGLDFLPAGATMPDPPKLLHKNEMRELVEHVSGNYDKVIIDSAPVLTVTDSVILSDWADGIILVIQGLRTSRRAIVQAKETLLDKSSKIIGAVVNNLPMEQGGQYYYGYKYNYGYKYGSEHQKRSDKKKAREQEKEEVII
ncbi:MAG: polysaccharide biosynthesis tyrosine autokinase [Candidatus Omnitrophica bacterium]|nr:polysaccharide biosynthesis tyrosine autokinase [Candidatus Omnitrophota bacterium]